MHNNPFIEKRSTIALPALVTRIAGLVIASQDTRQLMALCDALDNATGSKHYSKLFAAIWTDYPVTFDRLRTYAIEYIEQHALLMTR